MSREDCVGLVVSTGRKAASLGWNPGPIPTLGSMDSIDLRRSSLLTHSPQTLGTATKTCPTRVFHGNRTTLVRLGSEFERRGVATEGDNPREICISCHCIDEGSWNVTFDPGTDTEVHPDAFETSEDPRRREGTRGRSSIHSRMVGQAKTVLSLIMMLVTAFVSEGTSSGSKEAGHGIELQGDTLAVALDGSAFLSSYYLGVLDSLAELGIVRPGTTKVSGISAGSLVALASCMSYPYHDALNLMKAVAEKCKETWEPKKEALPCQGRLYEEVIWIVEQIIGDDPDAYKKCSGKLRTFLLALNPKTRGQTRSETQVIEQFESNQDLAEGVQAATFVPCWSSCQPYVIYRGMPVIDGAFEMPLEQICPDGASPCIRVQVNHPGKYRKAPHAPCSLAGSQLLCFGENHVRTLGCFPGERTAPFEARGILPKRCPYFPLRVPPAMRNANIFPGMFAENPLPSTCYRHQCGLMIPEPSSLDSLFELGRKDAALWASEQQSHGM